MKAKKAQQIERLGLPRQFSAAVQAGLVSSLQVPLLADKYA